jgi:hypothetical protein
MYDKYFEKRINNECPSQLKENFPKNLSSVKWRVSNNKIYRECLWMALNFRIKEILRKLCICAIYSAHSLILQFYAESIIMSIISVQEFCPVLADKCQVYVSFLQRHNSQQSFKSYLKYLHLSYHDLLSTWTTASDKHIRVQHVHHKQLYCMILCMPEIIRRHIRRQPTPVCLMLLMEIWLQIVAKVYVVTLPVLTHQVSTWVFLLVSDYVYP